MGLAQEARDRGQRWSIGQVLERLNSDFDDLSLSKLRFLEERGLVTPERTSSGYRKFSQEHIERIRLVLTLQRDHYLPLKVISDYLEELDAGNNPEIPGVAPEQTILRPQAVLTRDELLKRSGASPKLFAESIAVGLIPALEVYPQEILEQLHSLVALEQRGITPRHLRQLRLSVERDAELLRQVAAVRGRVEGSPSSREDTLELAAHIEKVRAGVLRNKLLG